MFGWRGFGRGWDRMAQRHNNSCALAHVGWLGLPRGNRRRSNRVYSHHTTPGLSRGQKCRIPDNCERFGGHMTLVCGGRPGRRTGLHWPARADVGALGGRPWAWGGASLGWMPGDNGFLSGFVVFSDGSG